MYRVFRKSSLYAGIMLMALTPVTTSATKNNLIIFDGSGNLLQQSKLEYQSDGTISKRTTYAPDMYFLRTTQVTKTTDGKPSTEVSTNYDGREIAKSSYAYSTGQVVYSLVDDNKLVVNVAYTTQGTEAKLLGDDPEIGISTFNYIYSENELQEIQCRDKDGKSLFVAKLTDQIVASKPSALNQKKPLVQLQASKNGQYRVFFNLATSEHVQISMYNLAGRRIAQVYDSMLKKGVHQITGSLSGSGSIAKGMYFIHVYAGETSKIQQLYYMSSSSSGFDRFAGSQNRSTTGEKSNNQSALLSKSVAGSANEIQLSITPALLLELLFMNGDIGTSYRPQYSSIEKIVMSPDGKSIYAALDKKKVVSFIDAQSNAIGAQVQLPNEPTGMAISKDGSLLYVTCASQYWPIGYVHTIDIAQKKIVKSVEVGHSARNPILSPDNSKLYLSNVFKNSVSAYSTSSWQKLAEYPVQREPYSGAITPNGQTLVIANSLAIGKAEFLKNDTNRIAANVSLIDIGTGATNHIALLDGSHSLHGVAITPDGQYAFIPHIEANFRNTTTEIAGGWINRNVFSIIDLSSRRFIARVYLDDLSAGAANPWDCQINETGQWMAISESGSGHVTVINVPGLIAKVKSASDQKTFEGYAFLESLKKRVTIIGKSPRSVAMYGNTVYVANYFSNDICSFDAAEVRAQYAISPTVTLQSPAMTKERLGEFYFHDGSIGQESWQSCHSCHPFVRTDMLNWDLLKDGLGNFRNAKSMLWAHRTPPTHADGGRDNARDGVRAGLKFELFIVRDLESIAAPIDTFLSYLKPYPSPYLNQGKLTSLAEQGKTLYNGKAGCAVCHPAPHYAKANGQLYDVGTGYETATIDGVGPTTISRWDPPTCVETWRTAPYGHHGRYDTMQKVLRVLGHAPTLTDQEYNAVEAYVLSL